MSSTSTYTKSRLVRVNSNKTVSLLGRGKPPRKDTIISITGEPLQALIAGKTVKVDKRNYTGFVIQA